LPKYLAVVREAAEDQTFPQVCGRRVLQTVLLP
jgi:hypothetical protein